MALSWFAREGVPCQMQSSTDLTNWTDVGPIVAGTFHPYMEFRKMIAQGKPVDIDYGHPELAPLLKDVLGETVGHVLYQDQVLQISCAVAGFTPGQADKLRRAMSRKRSSEAMQALAAEFYEGAAAQGVSQAAAKVAFDKMAAFAAFGFPKSHAVAFALLAYESTWLRYHYPTAYYCSLFNAQPMGYSVEVLTGDATRHGIQVLPLHQHQQSHGLARARRHPPRPRANQGHRRRLARPRNGPQGAENLPRLRRRAPPLSLWERGRE
jgi:DNA polymerase III alpha subunit